MKLNKNKKIFWIVLGIVVIVAVLLIIFLNGKDNNVTSENTGNNGGTSIEIVPLSSEEINILGQNVLYSEAILDLPSNGIIGLQFYSFEEGERVWRSGFLIGKEGFLNSGSPDFVLIMHAKYIADLNEKGLCEVVQSAKANGDMWVESELSNAKLLLKYSSMMKYRNCFGF